ncbi:MAG TPA: Nudix family hydrolase [Rhodanobacteraceae bacterium]|nr:Nudix family hydrolase [Rhodanobacteraceae bacterium]
MTGAPIHVVAGILRDHEGRVLVAQRPPGKHLEGFWEFPGGKSDPGEAPGDALRRELAEEIGIHVESAEPLIAVPWTYPEKRIVLDAWLVDRYRGEAHAREGQALRWVDPDELASLPMPPADAPIVTALALPYRYAITPVLDVGESRTLLAGIERLCAAGIRMIQLRQPTWPERAIEAAAVEAHAICTRHGAELLVNADWRLAERAGLDGVHLPARIAATLDARPVGDDLWLAVSCHDAAELAHAVRIGSDFATLAPVAPTPSHADATPLGWPRFAGLVQAAALPVYALGGLGIGDIHAARRHGAQGIAAIRAFWR